MLENDEHVLFLQGFELEDSFGVEVRIPVRSALSGECMRVKRDKSRLYDVKILRG